MKKQKVNNNSYRSKRQPNKPVGWQIILDGKALFKETG